MRARNFFGAILCLIAAAAAGAQATRARGALIAVSNEAGHSVTLIDATSLRVLRTVPLPQRPRGIQFTPDGKKIFVALSDPQIRAVVTDDAIEVAVPSVSRSDIAAIAAKVLELANLMPPAPSI
jgi:DNA-binding beta-propeller fold protein YncE